MKSILRICVPMLLTTMGLQSAFAWDYSVDSCGMPERNAYSKAAYACAPNALAKNPPHGHSYYEVMVFQNYYRSRDLTRAVLSNNIPEVRKQLQAGQDPNGKLWEPQWMSDDLGHQPMFHPMRLIDFAAYIGNTEVLKILLNEPSTVVNDPLVVPNVGEFGGINPQDPTSALSYAVYNSHPDAIRVVLQHPRFQILATPEYLFFNAVMGVQFGWAPDTKILNLLLSDRRLDPNTIYGPGLGFESEAGQWHMEVVRNVTPLMAAVMFADVKSVKALLTSPRVIQGLELKAADGSTALQLAKKGLRKVSRDTENREAVESRYKECIRLLIAAGAKGWSI